MLKVRVMPVLLHSDVGLVKGIAFDSWRRVGTAMPAVKVYNLREVDELVFLDVNASRDGRTLDTGIVEDISGECFVPLTVGGGIRNVDDVRRLLMAGADKISVNTAGIGDPALIGRIADRFGSQCVVASVDARLHESGYQVWTHAGTVRTTFDPVEVCAGAEAMGAGEILITSIDRDGTMSGYDVELVRRVADAVRIPVIANGGAGTYRHMAEVLARTTATAVAAASMFHFTERTPREAKRFLAQEGFAVRL